VSFGPEAFVALRRFVPYIQTMGSGGCDEIVALVPGGEPVGSESDYKLFLGFYTGRTIETTPCEKLNARAKTAPRPAWIILDDEHLKHCLTPEARKSYPGALRVGTQYLLGPAALNSPVADLTPLELDRLAIPDPLTCKAPPYPEDIWHRYLPAQR
jgi:hypothetical protein